MLLLLLMSVSSLPKAVIWKRTSRFEPATFSIASERSTITPHRPHHTLLHHTINVYETHTCIDSKYKWQ